MFKGTLIGLFIISLVAMLATEVYAGCYNIGGEAVCADWYVGSEICSVTVATKATNATIATTSKSSTTSLDCGQDGCKVICKVFGTVPEQEKASKDGTTDSGEKFCKPGDDDCGIFGFVFCQNSTGETDREQLTLTEANVDLPLRGEHTITVNDCVRSGSGVAVCHTSIDVDVRGKCRDCCTNPAFPTFKTFTAQAFFGEVTVCPSNSESAECFSVIERCLVDQEAIRSGQSAAYYCNREPSEMFKSRWP